MSEAWRAAPTVLGIDGAPNGWALAEMAAEGPPACTLAFVPSLTGVLGRTAVAIDIPIGLPARITGTGRAAEQAIRPLLGARAASVFSIQSRAALYAEGWEEACATALRSSDPPRKPSRQGFHLYPKIREVDGLMRADPALNGSVFEGHAELAFWRLNGERPMATAKKIPGIPGAKALESRLALLAEHGVAPALFQRRPAGLPLADAVDAVAIALIARRCRSGLARPFPDPPDVDDCGLRIAIWA